MAELKDAQEGQDARARRRADAQDAHDAQNARGILPIDRLFLAYLLINTAIVLVRSARLPSWPVLLAANALAALLMILLARAPPSAFIDFTGGVYPLILAPAFYSQLGVITLDLGIVHDGTIQQLDAVLFGGQVSVTWHERMPAAALSWVLHLCYGAYYGILLGTPLYLFIRRSRGSFERGGFIMTLGLYACYVVFALFPVAGPRFVWGDATGPAAQVLPARLLATLVGAGSAWGTAFPSSHVAASWCAVYALWRDARRAALLVAPIAAGLALGTVYGQFHYAADTLAGGAAAALLCAAADPLRRALAAGSRSSP